MVSKNVIIGSISLDFQINGIICSNLSGFQLNGIICSISRVFQLNGIICSTPHVFKKMELYVAFLMFSSKWNYMYHLSSFLVNGNIFIISLFSNK